MEQDQPQQVEDTVEDLEIDEPIEEPDQETNGTLFLSIIIQLSFHFLSKKQYKDLLFQTIFVFFKKKKDLES